MSNPDSLLGMPVPDGKEAEAVRVFLIGIEASGTIIMLSREQDLPHAGADYKDTMNNLIGQLINDFDNDDYQPTPPPIKKPTRVVFFTYIDKWRHAPSPIEIKGFNDTFYDYEQENEAMEAYGQPYKAFSIHNAFENVPNGRRKRYEFNLLFYVTVARPPGLGSSNKAMREQDKEMILDPDLENEG